MRGRIIPRQQRTVLALALWLASCACAGAQPRPKRTVYRVQLQEISVQTTRSRRTDTNYAALSVQVGNDKPQSVVRRLGDMGRGTKAINMAFPQLALRANERLTMAWAVANYGRDAQADVLQALRTATERWARRNDDKGLQDLSEALSDHFASEPRTCDGPVLAGLYEIDAADLLRQSASKPLRITRRQTGLEAPDRCGAISDYAATIVVTRGRGR